MPNHLTISHLALQDFTAFAELELSFVPGVNVLIGSNGSGKTHLMKLMYSNLKAMGQLHKAEEKSKARREEDIAEWLMGVFKPERLGRLVRRGGRGRHTASIQLDMGNAEQSLAYTFSTQSVRSVKLSNFQIHNAPSCLFIPGIEMLTLYPGFQASYMNRETAYDRTFYELALALDAGPSRGPKEEEANALLQPIYKHLNIKVGKKGKGFFIKLASGENLEAVLAAEGVKKIAMLQYLIGNGSIRSQSIIFWDEPEAYLNPLNISMIADLIIALAQQGVQLFVSTHDYLLSQHLSLRAENDDKAPPMRFFNLMPHGVEIGDTLADISDNPILNGFLRYADEEQAHP